MHMFEDTGYVKWFSANLPANAVSRVLITTAGWALSCQDKYFGLRRAAHQLPLTWKLLYVKLRSKCALNSALQT